MHTLKKKEMMMMMMMMPVGRDSDESVWVADELWQ